MLKVVIAGRPNVGKSSVFNKLVGARNAIVHNMPGVTRDVIEGIGKIGDLKFRVWDTAGIEKGKKKGLEEAISELAWEALRASDLILFVVDGAHGIHPGDEAVAREVRKLGKPVLLLMNKVDSKKAAGREHEFMRLGFGEPVAISAEHRVGFHEIEKWIEREEGKSKKVEGKSDESAEPTNDIIKISIMGQPNVGKSTLINKIIGEKRMLAFDQPGVTRDTVQVPFEFAGRELMIVDTPGLRRKSKVMEDIETIAALKALAVIEEVDAVVLVIDATLGVEKYDLNLAARVVQAGKVLIIAINKWDKVKEGADGLRAADSLPAKSLMAFGSRKGRQKSADGELADELLLKLKHDFKNSFNQIVKPIMLPISAEVGTGVKNLMKRVLEAVDKNRERLPTSFINRVVEKLVKKNPPPLSRIKRPMKIKFAAQTGVAPVEVTLYVNEAVDLPESYERYLRNGIAKEVGWESLVVRINYKKGSNPYKD